MTDQKRLRAEQEHKITQAEIDAWVRGDKDALKNAILKANSRVSPEVAIRIVKLFAELGDVHFISTRLDVPLDETRRILSTFGIASIEDARTLVKDGIIAEYDVAKQAQQQSDTLKQKEIEQEAQKRLDQHNETFTEREKDASEVDQILQERKKEAAQKNKKDTLRSIIADGIDPSKKISDFKIRMNDVKEFRYMIPQGITALQKRFGGTKQDLIREVKRIAPHINLDLLRP